ncbi:MAG: class I SAM-dependent methyltransferase [Candidatus Omnitrophica bacterium]|nr:class I SAM-dependent methyltransferase [Candidatus Omnitrophota bacterium]
MTALPRDKDWDAFWALQKTGGTISWSKRRILQVVALFLKEGGRFLDAGCGSGFFSKAFLDCGQQVTALDYSDEALKMARELTAGRVACLKEDLLSPGLDARVSGRFDCIFSDGLLEHFKPEDQGRILKNLASLLTPDGYIITFVPNRFSPWEIIRPFLMPGITEEPFVLSGLVRLHERNSLSCHARGGINTLPFQCSPEFAAPLFGMLLYVVAKK